MKKEHYISAIMGLIVATVPFVFITFNHYKKIEELENKLKDTEMVLEQCEERYYKNLKELDEKDRQIKVIESIEH